MCRFELGIFFENDLPPTFIASLTQKYWRANLHSGICIHCWYIHNSHGLAILVCITPFRNMHPSPIYPQSWPCHSMSSHLKRSSKKWFSPQISSKPPSPQETEPKKAPRISSNKREVNILRGEKHFNFKNSFWWDFIFSPSIIPIQKLFPKSLRKFS
jgi:hypothetical protein